MPPRSRRAVGIDDLKEARRFLCRRWRKLKAEAAEAKQLGHEIKARRLLDRADEVSLLRSFFGHGSLKTMGLELCRK